MNRASYLLKSLAGRGVSVRVAGPDQLDVRGEITDDDRREIRALKPELVALLSRGSAPRDYSKVRAFPYRIGDSVTSPWGPSVVWGITYNEVLVDTGVVVLGFGFDQIK